MKTKTVLLVIMTVIISTWSGNAFADHTQVDVSVTSGSNTPGCETTNECYIPSEIIVDVGGEVTWTNDGTSSTTITSGTVESGPNGFFDSGLVEPGSSFSFKFDEHGEYHYFSMIHPWMSGMVIVQDEHDDHEDKMIMDEHGAEHTDETMPMEEEMTHEGDAAATGMLSDGTMVSIWTAAPISGEMMAINIEFKDAEHVNHDIKVTQNDNIVLDDIGAHHHNGKGIHMTQPLDSSDPVEVTITFQGYGKDEKTGPIGEVVVFSNVVPEFGTIAMMMLSIAIISVIAITAKSKLSSRV